MVLQWAEQNVLEGSQFAKVEVNGLSVTLEVYEIVLHLNVVFQSMGLGVKKI